MSFMRKYGFGLALAVAVIYAYAPPIRDDIAKLRWLDDINVIISKVLAPANREAGAGFDPVAAANTARSTGLPSCPAGEVVGKDGARSSSLIRTVRVRNLPALRTWTS